MAPNSPRLDIGTKYDHGKGLWGLRILQYPNGGFEGVLRLRDMTGGRKKLSYSSSNPEKEVGKDGDGGEWENTAPRRARTAIRRHVMGSGCDRMLTLTYRDNFTDRAESRKHLQLLLRRLKRWINDKDFHFIAVPEYQKRGAIHWHIGLNRRVEVVPVRAAWLEIIGGSGGNIDIQKFHNPAKQAAYMAKYIGKEVEKDEQRGTGNRYVRSRGLRVPELYFRAETQSEALQRFYETTGERWDGTIFEHNGTYWLPAF